MFICACRLWLMDDERVLHKMDVQGSDTEQISITDQWYDLVLCSSSGGQLVMYGVICGEDYSWQVRRDVERGSEGRGGDTG
jgi:hypothetical protein